MNKMLKLLVVTIAAIWLNTAYADTLLPAYNEEFLYENCYYEILSKSEKTCRLIGTSMIGDFSNFDIPMVARDKEGTEYTVISIGHSATQFANSYIITATMPNTITEIQGGAFAGCSTMSSINLSNNLTVIENSAFKNCKMLREIELPDGLTTIGDEAFMGCSGLSSIMIPSSVTSIGIRAFHGCNSLKRLKFYAPECVAECCFDNSLEYVEIGNNVTTIPDGFMRECNGIKEIQIPSSVKKIGTGAFSYCEGLTYISIPASVWTIESRAFYGCSNLKVLQLNNDGRVYNKAFYGCSNLESIYCTSRSKPYCDSDVFDFDTYRNATLYVPIGCYDEYHWSKDSCFWQFLKIEESDFSSVKGIEGDNMSNIIDYSRYYEVYDLSGILRSNNINNLPRGMYLIRQNSTVKTIMKQ